MTYDNRDINICIYKPIIVGRSLFCGIGGVNIA